MSKSLGTGIDPLELIDRLRRRRHALRPVKMSLHAGRALRAGRDRRGPRPRQQALERLALRAAERRPRGAGRRRRPRSPIDRWMLSRLAATDRRRSPPTTTPSTSRTPPRRSTRSSGTRSATGTSRRSSCVSTATTPVARRQASEMALFVLERTLALLHPLMPFVTEEIWAFLPDREGYLVHAPPRRRRRPRARRRGRAPGRRRHRGHHRPAAAAPGGRARPARAARDRGLRRRRRRRAARAGRPAARPRARGADGTDVAVGVPIPAGDATVPCAATGSPTGCASGCGKRLADAEAERARPEAKLGNPRFVERAPAGGRGRGARPRGALRARGRRASHPARRRSGEG